MTTLKDLILDSLNEGINEERLLKAVGLDRGLFYQKLEDNQFRDEERKVLKQEIKDWQDGK